MEDWQLRELPRGRIKAMAQYNAVPSPPAFLFPSPLVFSLKEITPAKSSLA